jgi:hypothetical protein
VSLNVFDHFGNREAEIGLFYHMLSGEELGKRILCLTMAPEQGKTWFIQHLHYECERNNVPVALLDFDRDRSGMIGDIFSIAGEIRRHLGDERTPAICACERTFSYHIPPMNAAEGEGGVDFGERGDFTGGEVHHVAGRDQVQIGTIIMGSSTPEQVAHHKDGLGRALCDDLACLGRAVLLVDTFERVPEETRGWLERWLFQSLRRQLPQLLLVVGGRPECRTFFDQPHLWSHLVVHRDHFKPFSREHALDYYRRRGLQITEIEVSFLRIACSNPSRMADLGNILEQTQAGAR